MDYMTYIWSAVLALHIISIAYWTGGSLVASQTDRSIFRNDKSLEEQTLRLNAFRRFYKILLHVALITLVTGGALIVRMVQNHMQAAWPLHVMAAIGLLMFVLFLYISLVCVKKAARSLRPDPLALNKIRKKTLIMGLWGVVAIVMGSLAHFNV